MNNIILYKNQINNPFKKNTMFRVDFVAKVVNRLRFS